VEAHLERIRLLDAAGGDRDEGRHHGGRYLEGRDDAAVIRRPGIDGEIDVLVPCFADDAAVHGSSGAGGEHPVDGLGTLARCVWCVDARRCRGRDGVVDEL
jgi:hypothetical protein